MRVIRTAMLAGAAGLVLAACGGDDPQPAAPGAGAPQAPTATPTPAPATPSPATPPPATPPPATADGAAEAARPAPGQCVLVPAARDGLYSVFDAGTAVVRHEGDRLVLGRVTTSPGWTSRVDHEEPDEVEIDFRRGGANVLDLEVEIDDGRIEAEICADDD